MGKWDDMYQSKLRTAEEAARIIKDNDKIMCGSGSCTPDAFLNALFDRVEELNNVVFGGLIMLGPTYKILNPEASRHILFDNMYASPLDRHALAEGISVHSPFNFSDVTRQAVEFGGYKKIVTQCGPMDKNGYLCAGVSGNFLDTLQYGVEDIILEVNEHQPRIHGYNFYHISQVTAVIENPHPLFDLPPEPVGEIDKAIAENIVPYIDDGCTIQLGIGALPNAIGECIVEHGRQHLGCYTEMIPDCFMSLFEAGILDNSKKNYYPLRMNAFFSAGSNALYQWLDENPAVFFNPISINNNPYNVAQNDNLISINSTLEMDITGQCCSEALGNKQYSATGGAQDFGRGAWLSKGGKGFIALHSTAVNKETGETISKIVPTLRPGTPVTMSRTEVMYVATEYGVVNLRGKNNRERAQALISICHPDFRGELRQYAKDAKLFILPEHDIAD